MKQYFYLLFFILFTGLLSAFPLFSNQSSDDHITVGLATESSLEPLYLFALAGENSAFDANYLQKLNEILQFDIQHNGMTYLVKHSPDQDTRGKANTDELGSASSWKKEGIFYVVKLRLRDKSLSALVLNTRDFSLKKINDLSLSGDFNQDRRQAHKLADAIFKALFDKEGIATTKILYTIKLKTGEGKWVSSIAESDYDGGNPRVLTESNAYCVTPVYIPPKSGYSSGSILYTSYEMGQPKIYLSSLKDGKKSRLTYLRGNQLMPAISKQRDKVAFISDVTGNPDLFLQPFSPETGAIGKPEQIFSARQATQGSPTFSPEGKKMAFVSDKDGSARIYVLDIPKAGTPLQDIKAQLISKKNRDNTAPSWSPDGTKLAYCSNSNGHRQIWVYDFASREEKPLTHGPGHKENPSWAPDSLHLVYNSADADNSELYLISLHEPEAIKIPLARGEKRFPCWEPR